MKPVVLGGLALLTSISAANALGLDRTGQDISPLFETGNYVRLSFGSTQPSLTGTDVLGNTIDNVGQDFHQTGLALKLDVAEGVSFGLIVDKPYGADIAYGGDPATTILGGTSAHLDSRAITAIGRYRLSEALSFHAGLSHVEMDGKVTLSGAGYGLLSSYSVDLDKGSGSGWLAGVSYERPEIALRVSLTYHSAIDTAFDTNETSGFGSLAATTTVTAPQAWNLDFQTGIAKDTLLFGTLRYADYSQTILSPDFFGAVTGGGSITDIDSGMSYSLGLARRFSDSFAGSIAIGFEPAADSSLVSPLTPLNGSQSVMIGGRYTRGNMEIGLGLRYTKLGDAKPEIGTPDLQVATFKGNDALSLGLSIGYRF